MCISIKSTVFFEEPFWIGLFERNFGGKYQVSRFVFGSEPKDYEVYDFLLNQYYNLKFSNFISADGHIEKKVNPKKLQKKISTELENVRVGTKAQIAIKLQYETNKVENKKTLKEKREEFEERKFELKQLKKKEKHKGH